MKIHLYHAFLFGAAIVLLLVGTYANAGEVTGDIEVSSDNEGMSTSRYLVGYNDNFADWILGVKHGKFNVSDLAGSVSLNDTRITFYNELDERTHIWGYLGRLYNSNQSERTSELGIGHVVNNKLYVEYNLSENTFDTFITINNRLSYIDQTAMFEYHIAPRLTGLMHGSTGSLSDGNNYKAYKGSLVYDSDDVDGLSAQFHRRYKSYDFNNVGYFGPGSWTQNLIGVGYVTESGQWSFNGRLLTGPQSIDDTSGAFTELKLNLKYAVSNDADIKLVHDRVISTADGYEYNWNWTGIHFKYRF